MKRINLLILLLCFLGSISFAQEINTLKERAEQGHADAQAYLGYCYDVGKGVTQDYAQAVYWYQKAAEQGNVAALKNLGLCYEYGKGGGS